MAYVYPGYVAHGITLGDCHTYNDFLLVPTSRPVINPPETKTRYVDVPGADGSVDLTEALGRIVYEDRSGDWEFMVLDKTSWAYVYSKISGKIHGQKMKVSLDDDSGYYYIGRVFVDKWKSSQTYSTITISYILEPYKYAADTSGDDWLWDPFSFLDGVIQHSSVTVTDTETVNFVCGRMVTSPTIKWTPKTSGKTVDVTYGDTTVTLSPGTTTVYDFVFTEGDNLLTFEGAGTAVISYVRGYL